MAEMEVQYTKQFQKLKTEVEKSRRESEQMEKKWKERESNFNAYISQTKYDLEEKDKRLAAMTDERRKLEVISVCVFTRKGGSRGEGGGRLT